MEERNESQYSGGQKHILKATELRIGNWIYDGDCQIEIQIGTGLHIHNLSDKSKPMPLTEEWLVKFGFECTPSKRVNKAFILCKLEIVLTGMHDYPNGRTYFNSWCIMESQPKHVHQLQNLYFALTGQELTIKEQ